MYFYSSWWAVCGPEGERTPSLTKQIRLGRVCTFCPILVFLLVRTVGWLAVICETALRSAWDLWLASACGSWLCAPSASEEIPPSQLTLALQRSELAEAGNCGWCLPRHCMDPVQCGLVCSECRGNCDILRFGIVIKIGAITATIYVISI